MLLAHLIVIAVYAVCLFAASTMRQGWISFYMAHEAARGRPLYQSQHHQQQERPFELSQSLDATP